MKLDTDTIILNSFLIPELSELLLYSYAQNSVGGGSGRGRGSNSAPNSAGVPNLNATLNNNNNNSNQTIPRPPRVTVVQSISSNLHDGDWSVRVSIILAVDFPLHVVPNMPLSPVLKLGLVSIPMMSGTSSSSSSGGTVVLLMDTNESRGIILIARDWVRSRPE